MGEPFSKQRFAWGEKLWANFLAWGLIVYMGTNDQITQGGKLMVKRFQRSSQDNFSSH